MELNIKTKKNDSWWQGFEACHIFQLLVRGVHLKHFPIKAENLQVLEELAEDDLCKSTLEVAEVLGNFAFINIIPKNKALSGNTQSDE